MKRRLKNVPKFYIREFDEISRIALHLFILAELIFVGCVLRRVTKFFITRASKRRTAFVFLPFALTHYLLVLAGKVWVRGIVDKRSCAIVAFTENFHVF